MPVSEGGAAPVGSRRLVVPVSAAGPIQHQIYLERFSNSGAAGERQQIFHFPVNPEQIEIPHRRDVNDVSLLRLGTLSRLGPSTPLEVSFSAFFPTVTTPPGTSWLNVPAHQLQDPWVLRKLLRDWQTDDDVGNPTNPSPLRLSITETSGFSIWVAITAFEASTRPRELGDLYYTITFREIGRLPDLRRSRAAKPRRNPRRPIRPAKKLPRGFVRAVKGDTLAKIAMAEYGEVSTALIRALWRVQTEATRKAMRGDRTAKIPPGTDVRLPALAKLNP